VRKILIFLYFFTVAGIFLSMVFAGDEVVTVRAEVNKAFATIGERILCTVFVRHSPEVRLVSAIEFPNTRDFEIKSAKDIPPKEEKGIVMTGRTFEIAAYGLGDFVIEEIPVRYVMLQGAEKEIKTNRIYITVQSVDKNGKPKTDIRGIKAPFDLPSELRKWLSLGITTFLLFLAGIVVLNFFRKKKAAMDEARMLLSPHDEAYQALRTLYNSSLIRDGKVKDYYFRLSEIIRRYLERRFAFAAVEKTTDEIFRDLREILLEDTLKRLIRAFLEEVDIVKFAKYLPEPREIVLINKRATEIVDKTKLAEPAATADLVRSHESGRSDQAAGGGSNESALAK